MKKEKIILSFLAVIGGLLVAGVSYFAYQSTKVIPTSNMKTISLTTPSPVQKSSVFLSIDNLKDEDVVDKKTITISGKTISNAIIVLSDNTEDQVVTPAQNGNFSITETLDNGVNKLEFTAIAPNGEQQKVTKIITYSTESF